MFIKNHNAALSDVEASIEPYMANGVVVDSEGYLSVMLPLSRNTLAIKFAGNDPVIAEMAARALSLFENMCSSEAAHAFYGQLMQAPELYDRVMQFVTIMLKTDEALGTLTLSKEANKRHGKLLSDIRLVGEMFGFYDKKTKTYTGGITRAEHPNGMTKELMLPPEIVAALMCYYINGQRVRALISL